MNRKVPQPCNLGASQNHTLTVPLSQGPEPLRALCLASGNTEMRSSSGKIAMEWRSEDEPRDIKVLRTQSIAKSYPNSFTLSRSRAFASHVLGKRKYRDEYKPPLNRPSMALRERSALCVPVRVTWGRYRRGSAPMFIGLGHGPDARFCAETHKQS